uniref:Ig-like domain-containing protein n=1 Tax=Sinocyclocheilus anshuiensis TaxID=1608454 RepID=A0A671PE59_9TELE
NPVYSGTVLHFLSANQMLVYGIAPVSPNEFVLEGNTITLSCNYNGSAATDALHWYRQYPRSRPDFLFLSSTKHVTYISSAKVTDSALYYCALQPTVTGNTSTLYKMKGKTTKRKTQQRSNESNSVLHAEPPFPRLNASVNKVEKQVHLKISSAAVTDSALYYCALEPTVSGNTRTLYKNHYRKSLSCNVKCPI